MILDPCMMKNKYKSLASVVVDLFEDPSNSNVSQVLVKATVLAL